MANTKLPDRKLFNAACKLFDKGTTVTDIAERVGKPRATVQHWLKGRTAFTAQLEEAAKPKKIIVPATPDAAVSESIVLKDKIRTLEAQVKVAAKEQLSEHYVRTKIFKLAEADSAPPSWLTESKPSKKGPGVPTLFASDWHWGENVDPAQIGGKNAFNIEIAHARARRLITNAIDLLDNHMVNPVYPGIVFVLGGDMVSGDIHEELMATNDMEIMPTVVDLHGVLTWCIRSLADKFGQVFIPCVTGNHGRNTHKIRAKGRNYTSFDWLLYTFLEKTFNPIDPVTGKKGAGYDDRVKFAIPAGSDCLYSIYGHRYLLTHGDQFKTGDSMIGCLGPIIRGDHKKRSRNNQINMGYDTMICGHWHQLIQLERLIVNGSLKGYDEYAYSGNFGFEPPRQALWMTHPKHGITVSMPVLVEPNTQVKSDDWIKWSK